jgi:hypothetical protein
MTSGGLVRVLRVPDGNGTKIGRAARGTTAKPKADFRVAEELLAIVASELNASANEPGAAVQTRAPSRKTSRQARAIALLRVLGERVPANENLTALRRRVQLLQVDHTRSMKRMRSGPALDLEEAQGR